MGLGTIKNSPLGNQAGDGPLILGHETPKVFPLPSLSYYPPTHTHSFNAMRNLNKFDPKNELAKGRPTPHYL